MQWSSSEHDVEHAHYSCQICHLKKCTQCNKCRKLLLQSTFVCLLCAGWPAFVCWMELEVWFKSWRQRSTTASGSSPSSAGQKWKSSKETLFCEAFSIGIRCWWNGRETCTAKRMENGSAVFFFQILLKLCGGRRGGGKEQACSHIWLRGIFDLLSWYRAQGLHLTFPPLLY